MLGAIIGDIVGSRFEWNNYRAKDFDFFSPRCHVTDDTIMTIAVADALMACKGDYSVLGERAVQSMRTLGQPYPQCGYGARFNDWMYSPTPKPYGSYGNGAAMRVSPVCFVAHSLDEAVTFSRAVTDVTHNHPEGLKGAEAVIVSMWMALQGESKDAIRAWVDQHYYALDFTLSDIRATYAFDETCAGTVPQAIAAFLESVSFEDAIRNAVSIGGDSDTLAAITGSIAEAFYGVPLEMGNAALSYLDARLRPIATAFINQYGLTGRI